METRRGRALPPVLQSSLQAWHRRRGQHAHLLLLAVLLARSCAANPHHMTPHHTRAKLSHGQCSPPNGQFSQLGKIITAGKDMLVASANECSAACEANWHCTAWTWCMDEQGCTDELLSNIPYQGCQLKWEPHEPWGVPSQELAKNFRPSVFLSGYIKRRKPEQHTFIRLHSAPVTQLLIVTSVPETGCPLQRGDLATLMGILNKQDYARWHSYQFYLSVRDVDPTIRPKDSLDMWTWNKVALMQRVLAETPPERAPWILYMQPDTIIDDISFTFPFEMYQGKDWVSVGMADSVLQGWASGVDAGVFLVRNSPFIRQLFDDLAAAARTLPPPASFEEAYRPDPLAGAIARMIAADPDTYLDRFNFRSEICISCDWRRLELSPKSDALQNNPMKSWGTENKHWNLFVARFFECPFCFEDNNKREDEVSACYDAYLEHYEFAFCRFYRMELAKHREEELGGSHGHLTELGVPDALLNFSAPPESRTANTVLRAAKQHATSTGHECYQACMADSRCEMWVWCAHKAGCDDAGVFEGTYPYHGCQLMQLPRDVEPENWNRGPTFSSFESGYITGKHHSRSAAANASERIVIVTGIPTSPCTNPYGDYMLSLSIQNKQDWARLHSYEVHLMAEAVTSHIRAGPWQKVGFIQKALQEIPRERAEWIMWLDMDLLIDNIGFTLPLDSYEGKDLVMHGQPEWILQGEARAGMNSGVLLMRNMDWMRDIMARMAAHGTQPMDIAMEEHLRANLPSYEVGLYEQNVLTYLFYTNPELLSMVVFDVSRYGINCWWKDMYKPWVDNPAFIVHFAGCSTCSGFHPERLGDCDVEYIRVFSESFGNLKAEAARLGLAPGAGAAAHHHALPTAQEWST